MNSNQWLAIVSYVLNFILLLQSTVLISSYTASGNFWGWNFSYSFLNDGFNELDFKDLPDYGSCTATITRSWGISFWDSSEIWENSENSCP